MAVAGISLLALLVLGGLAFLGLSLLAGLFFHKQTRPVGLVILGGLLVGGLAVGVRGMAMQHAEAARRAEAVSEIRAVAAQLAAEAHGGGQWQAANHPQMGQTAPLPAPAQVSMRMSWAGIAIVAVVLFAAMKLLNRDRGLSATGWLGLVGLGLVVLIVGMNYLSFSTPRPAVVVNETVAPPLTASEAWDQITRPRIQLDAADEQIVLRANGREVKFSSDAVGDTVVRAVADLQPTLAAGEVLKVEFGDQSFDVRGRTSRERIADWLADARARAASPVGRDPAELAPDQRHYTVKANGKDTAYLIETAVADAVGDLRRVWLENGKTIRIDSAAGHLKYSGKFVDATVAELLTANQALAARSADGEEPAEAAVEEGAGQAEPASADGEPAGGPDAAPAESTEALPDWVEHTPPRIGEVYRQVIQSDPYVTEDECWDHIGEQLTGSAQEFAKRHLPIKPTPELMSHLGFSEGVLLRDIVINQHVETRYSEGAGQDMKILYLRLEFDQEFADQLDHAYKLWRRSDVVEGLALLAGSVLLLVGGVFALLKLDEATKGYYTKRLFIGVPVAIIGGGLLVAFLS